MPDQDDLWLMEELPINEPTELLETMPELRRYVVPAPRDEEGGLRSLLECPEALSRAWWRRAGTRKRPAGKTRRHSPAVLRAA